MNLSFCPVERDTFIHTAGSEETYCDRCQEVFPEDELTPWETKAPDMKHKFTESLCRHCMPKCDVVGCDEPVHELSRYGCCAKHELEMWQEEVKTAAPSDTSGLLAIDIQIRLWMERAVTA